MKSTHALTSSLVGCALFASSNLFAVTNYTGVADSWGTPSNWSGGSVPTGAFNQRININAGTTVTFGTAQGTLDIGSSVSADARALVLAATAGTATLNITGGTLQAKATGGPTGVSLVGSNVNGSIGLLSISGGLLDLTPSDGANGRVLTIGLNAATSAVIQGTVTVSGTGTLKVSEFRFNESSSNPATGGSVTGVLNLNAGGTVEAGVIREGPSGFDQSNTSSTVNFNGGTLKLTSSSGGISNSLTSATVLSGGAIIEVATSLNAPVAKALTAGSLTGGLTKQGAGTLTLSAANTYTGVTTVSTGTLALSAGGSIANSSAITIDTGATLSITGLSASTFTVGASQTIGGNGTLIATGKTVIANGTLSPGNSPGTLTQDAGVYQFGANGNLNWQIYDAEGPSGIGGYDTMDLTNSAVLDFSLLNALNPYNINLWSLSGISPDANGDAINFDNTQNYSWTLFTQDSAISGFDPTFFAINVGVSNGTTGFSNDLNGGMFTVSLGNANNSIVLNFTAVPEPSAALLGGLGLLAILRRRRH